MKLVATVDGRARTVDITGREGRYHVVLGDTALDVDARRTADGLYTLLVDGRSYAADVTPTERGTGVDVEGATYVVQVEEYARHVIRTRAGAAGAGGRQTITAPLPGKVTHIAVAPGQRIEAGATVIVIEAMKMENEFRAVTGGTVADVRVTPGQAVNAGDVMVVIE